MNRIMILAVAPAIASAFLKVAAAPAQQTAAQMRTEVLVASFNKSKHVVKDKRGVRKEKYVDVRSVPVAKANPEEYSGTYSVTDMGFAVQLRVDRNGNVTGSGYEPAGPDQSIRRQFTLTDGRVQGALLTATQRFANGERNRFEGVFINRTRSESPTDEGVTEFGLGVVGKYISVPGLTINKFFYQRQN
jgi:hypothetical protein